MWYFTVDLHKPDSIRNSPQTRYEEEGDSVTFGWIPYEQGNNESNVKSKGQSDNGTPSGHLYYPAYEDGSYTITNPKAYHDKAYTRDAPSTRNKCLEGLIVN